MRNKILKLSVLYTAILVSGFYTYSYSSDIFKIKPRNLKVNCKSLVIRCYCEMDGNDTIRKWQRCYYDDWDSLSYNNNGNILASYRFNSDWKMDSTFFEYDSLSNRISLKVYDSKGKLINHTKDNYKYDNKSRIIEESSTSTGHALVYGYRVDRAKTKYDESGNRTEYCLIDANGKELSKISYRYNEKRQIIEESSIIPGTSIINTEYYEYDEHGNRTLWDHYNRGKLYSRNLTKYDDRNNLTEYIEYAGRDGQLMFVFKTTIEYDDNNNQTKVNTYNEKSDLIAVETYSYKYDHQGNWTECIGYDQNKKPVLKMVRKINYY